MSVIMEICQKIFDMADCKSFVATGWNQSWCLEENFTQSAMCLSSSLKVIGTGTQQSATFNFLLVFSSNYGPISFHFRDKGKNLHPRTFNCLAEGVPLKFCNRGGVEKYWRVDVLILVMARPSHKTKTMKKNLRLPRPEATTVSVKT